MYTGEKITKSGQNNFCCLDEKTNSRAKVTGIESENGDYGKLIFAGLVCKESGLRSGPGANQRRNELKCAAVEGEVAESRGSPFSCREEL